MSRKRKRSGRDQFVGEGHKRHRQCAVAPTNGGLVKQALLSQYYSEVLTLREYMLLKLPASSKVRRKKISAVKWQIWGDRKDEAELDGPCLADFLDQTLVGVCRGENSNDERWRQWNSFSQRGDNSESNLQSVDSDGDCSQSELIRIRRQIVDFAIWQLFKQTSRSGTRVQHLVCQGFRRDINFGAIAREENPVTAIPGVVSTYPNHHVSMLKVSPWPQILAIMGKEGQRMMIDLLLDCGVFVAIESGQGNYFQLSGIPLGDLQVLPEMAFSFVQKEDVKNLRGSTKFVEKQVQHLAETRTPSRINFVRSRILYARAALNTLGNVRYGFRHIHVLNRCRYEVKEQNEKASGFKIQKNSKNLEKPSEKGRESIIHMMMYIFPREFGLHNVFTSSVDSRETVQPLKDYTLREEEIASIYGSKSSDQETCAKLKVPRRLKGQAIVLVSRLRLSHIRCSYDQLLSHYCPAPGACPVSSVMKMQPVWNDGSTTFDTQIDSHSLNGKSNMTANPCANEELPTRNPALVEWATPTTGVSAFCRSVLSALIPNNFWGEEDTLIHNKDLFMKFIDRFITLRRFETVSLHDAVQGMKIRNISWLGPPRRNDTKMSQSDLRKRLDLFHEFVYFAVDSLLMPLIRSHFFVTESNVHRYRIFFFRQDVWRSICEPQLTTLKHTMMEEMSAGDAQKILDSRTLGFSQLRLLPKERGVRPIMNLRRRPVQKGGKKLLGSSINSILAPVYNMYTYEKNLNPDRLGSSIFSVGDLYNMLKKFGKELPNSGKSLLFVKVDVQSAFDTIPQAAVLRLMERLPTESEYRISKYAEIKPGDGHRFVVEGHTKSKPIRKWRSLATSPSDFQFFGHKLEENFAVGKKHTVFVENIVNQFRDRSELLEMLSQHIKYNMVKIGKKFYRQKRGIPQGSVMSSILCNYFYADLEARHLAFLKTPGSLLLRLVDDFLLVTTEHQLAKKFLQIMHDGLPEYGVSVNPAKTLVNFEISINGMKVTRMVGTHSFPYCGSLINTKTLNITKDHERKKAVADALTVEFSKAPGKIFQRKVLNAFKLQAHAMFLDTSFNSLRTVFSNLYDNFVETATKMWRYAKCLGVQKQPGPVVVIRAIKNLVSLAFILIKSKGKNKKNEGYQCAVSQVQVEWLALTAFRSVLQTKQTSYFHVLAWLDLKIQALRDKKGRECTNLIKLSGLCPPPQVPVE